MKQLKFLETKRTPRYSLRKFSVGMVSVLLGVTIFGINFTNHSVKAATTESVKASKPTSNSQVVLRNTGQTNPQEATSATGKVQQNGASNGVPEKVQQNGASNGVPEKVQQNGASNDVTEKVQQNSGSKNATANNSTETATTLQSSPKTQGSASKNATANNPTESATTSQSLPKTQGSAHTYIRSLAAKSAAKLAFMNLKAAPGTDNGTYKDRSAAVTVNPDNINTQPAKENQKLANEHNLSSSDNYSSNIYKGTDGKYYKIITIYGNDYVYRAADIQASGANWRNYPKQTAEDTKNNISISKEDLGNGQTRWTVVFFPNKGLQNYHS